MSILSDRRKALLDRLRGDAPAEAASNHPTYTGYSNDRRAGRTHPEKRELRDERHPKFAIEISHGYKVRADYRVAENRADRRRHHRGQPVVATSPRSRALYPSIKANPESHARVFALKFGG